MKPSKLLCLLALPLLLSGCGNGEDSSSATQSNPQTKGNLVVTFDGMLRAGAQYNPMFNYDDAWFKESATENTKDLKLLSYASSIVASSDFTSKNFFSAMHYDLPTFYGYDKTTEESIGYGLTHKSMDGFEMVTVSIRGFDYGKEWANNMLLGQEGNHKGFSDKANEIYDSLKTYISKFDGKVKFWVTGYSRAGAVANCLASKLLKERNEISVIKDDLFVYTFEAPRCLSSDNAVAYENVFNYVNSADLIANILPTEYGLYRCGQEIAFNEGANIEAKITSFDKDAALPSFTAEAEKYADEKEFVQYFINKLLAPVSDASVTMQTRANYYSNYQSHISYFVGLYFSLDSNVRDALKSKFTSTSQSQIVNMIKKNELYEFIHPVLDKYSASYDSTKLDAACDAIGNLIKAKESFVTELISGSVRQNLTRSIAMHYPDVTYALVR